VADIDNKFRGIIFEFYAKNRQIVIYRAVSSTF